MAARIALALIAVLVLGWTGVLLRDYELSKGPAARSLLATAPTAAARARDLADLRGARTLNPDSSLRLARAALTLRGGDEAGAARMAASIARSEPDNLAAWQLLSLATRRSDPQRSLAAYREVRRLNPIGSRPAARSR